ncbi:hypothetical protein Bca52824_080373 [Brassica carinata]|uniref:Uncharacterized protein n=1 Tax=Brassica carinata TaxID=52824 RepID=A0A8X7TS68_BRACI|nr:hypothetical protein Bca52824_080372 [Brassica carinata]KAG2250237.1 hypothetical protein Bca52824_080373 [Brassica carinata]
MSTEKQNGMAGDTGLRRERVFTGAEEMTGKERAVGMEVETERRDSISGCRERSRTHRKTDLQLKSEHLNKPENDE